jgi:UDP-N-acetylglucosamine 2-epimerase (non-hydrolysing)
MTILGTRPEIIRLSRVVPLLDRLSEHVLVHTGQNYEESLSGSFFRELGLRDPDVHLGVRAGSFAGQVARVLEGVDRLLAERRPDRVVILGDTNSALSAIVAARRGIPVYHLEAGNRCFDDRVPEEVNRRLIDHASTVLLPYTQRSKENLVREGIERDRIFVIGNPIFEVLGAFAPAIAASTAAGRLGVAPGGYFLATFHRAENVDDPERLTALLDALGAVAERWGAPVLASVHPRTADRIARASLRAPNDLVRLLPPLGFADFVSLEKNARGVLSDSGTVQEECAIFGVPNVTIRDVTERPETLECGSNILSGVRRDAVLAATHAALSLPAGWSPPEGYGVPDVSRTVAKLVLGFLSLRRHRGEPGA